MREGLTLDRTFRESGAKHDSECLYQVTKIDDRQIWTTRTCQAPTSEWIQPDERRICRSDLIAARAFSTYIQNDNTPAVIGGTTFFSLSSASFRELKTAGETPHRLVAVNKNRLVADISGSIQRDRDGTATVLANDGPVTLPVVEASGMIGPTSETYLRATVVDDERFPLVLYYVLDDDSGITSIRYTTISFPAGGRVEGRLAAGDHVDVYGVYFDDDIIRPESGPVLREIAAALKAHRDWNLTVIVHTDNDLEDAESLKLSGQRSEAVCKALVGYGVASSRLTANGAGASQPKASNDTLEGRARNRRIELARQ